MPDLSVIVPTRNRAAHLRCMLGGLLEQTFPTDRFELIVVDNGSTDGTAAVVEEFRHKATFDLRSFREDGPGLHRGRHAGLSAARADVLVFADDDILPLPTWLEAIHDVFTDPAVALAGGKNLPHWEKDPPPWLDRLWTSTRYIPSLSILDLGDQRRDIDPRDVWGCNFSVRRAVVEQAKGFHPDSMPTELLQLRGDGETHVSRVAAAAGLRAVYDPRASVLHTVSAERMTFDYFERRAFAEGVSTSFHVARNNFRAPRRLHLFALLRALKRLKPILPERLYLRAITGDAFRRGFLWHQRLFATDPAVREWVLRADYLE